MNGRYIAVAALLGTIIASCETETDPMSLLPLTPLEQAPFTHAEVWEQVSSKLVDGHNFDWREVGSDYVFSAGVREDSLFSWGYWPDLATKREAPKLIGLEEIATGTLARQIEAVLTKVALIESRAQGRSLSYADLVAFASPEGIPQLTLRLTTVESVDVLRESDYSRYVEPMGYDPEKSQLSPRSDSGCGVDPDYGLPSGDYTVVSPGVKVPWNYSIHGVQEAWTASQGAGVGIQIIDTGSSDGQENVGHQFASGQSTGRNIRRLSTLYSGSWWWRRLDSPNDGCGHGTQMSGLATGPRGSDGNAVGVAYRANLTIVRAVEDVVITSSNESAGVRDALVLAGNDPGVRIISMSIGTPFNNGTVADGIYFAHNRGKLIFAAAGTSLTWTSWYGVIFPASMSETVAVTGVKEGLPFERCATCHDGSQVDFVIHMARRYDPNRTSLSLARSGDQPTYVGGSSCATATTAGVAALVWAKSPQLSRQGVLDRLRTTASGYPNRDRSFGWGAVNAAAAVAAN